MRAESQPAGAWKMFAGICFGALVALVVGYAASYVMAHFGLGVIGSTGGGRAVFSRAALNLYAMQHVILVGGNRDVFAAIAVPISLWALVPALALLIGGYQTASLIGGSSRTARLAAAILSGVLYALALAAVSRVIWARFDAFLVPQISGFESNPQEFPFRPSTRSTLLFAGLFGVIFAYLGALIATRSRHASIEPPGRWWACAKAVVVVALVIQLLIVLAAVGAGLSKSKKGDNAAQSHPWSVVELLPTAGGIGYSLINGGTLVAGVQTHTYIDKKTTRLLYTSVSLPGGIVRDDVTIRSRKPTAAGFVAAGVALGTLAALAMGWFAVAWGSGDGALPTAVRIGLIHTAILAMMVLFCGAEIIRTDPVSATAMIVKLRWGVWLLYSFIAVLVFAFLGASRSHRTASATME